MAAAIQAGDIGSTWHASAMDSSTNEIGRGSGSDGLTGAIERLQNPWGGSVVALLRLDPLASGLEAGQSAPTSSAAECGSQLTYG